MDTVTGSKRVIERGGVERERKGGPRGGHERGRREREDEMLIDGG